MNKNYLNKYIYKPVRIITYLIIALIIFTYCFFDFYPKKQDGTAYWQEVSPNIELLKNDVTFLAGLKRSFQYKEDFKNTIKYIEQRAVQNGYVVKKQPFQVKISNNIENFVNLIITYGNDDAKERIVIGAHYDTANNPGADDNGSAVAGLLEIARLLEENKPSLNKRIDMVFYANEEPPFFATQNMGSAHHFKSIIDKEPITTAMIALEMIGYYSDESGSQRYPLNFMKRIYGDKGNFITVVGNLKARKLVHNIYNGLASTKLPANLLVAPNIIPVLMFSDHLNYANDIPSVMITDTAFYRNPNYHKATDLPETLDYEKMALAVEGTYQAVVDITK